MTRDDVIRMVREIADKTTVDPVHGDPPLIVVSPDEMCRFAELVAAAEREACAKFVENWSYSKECAGCDQPTPQQYAQAIRARGEV
jgi:hypothetical protein